jgi:hypothetical protein
MALCSTGALLVADFPLEAAGPMRLLAGRAEAEPARAMERVMANRLAIRVVFIVWFCFVEVSPFGLILVVFEHRLHRVINLPLRKPLGKIHFVVSLANFLFGRPSSGLPLHG